MSPDPSPQQLLDQLTAAVAVEPLGDDAFEGHTPRGALTGVGRVYGGQVIAQALAAAAATVPDDRPPHSLHAYFLRMGSDARPIRYDVARDLEGGRFSNRRVSASQETDAGHQTILSLNASFHRVEPGMMHQDAMPDVPPPEDLVDDAQVRKAQLHLYPEGRRAAMGKARPIEQRTVEHLDWLDPQPAPPVTHTWLRACAPLGDSLALHRAVFAYASDLVMLRTATLPHGIHWFAGEMQEASLDHALWFHDDFRMDEWLLFQTRGTWAGRARGYITAQVFTRDGRLVASATQEGLIRPLKR